MSPDFFEEGLFPDVSDEVYHKMPWMSNSRRKVFRQEGPEVFKYRLDTLYDWEGTKATELGTLLHLRLLQPELFMQGKSHWVRPVDPSYYSKSGAWNSVTKSKDWIAAAKAQVDVPIISEDDVAHIQGAAQKLFSDPDIGPLFAAKNMREVVVLSIHEQTGMKCKARLDLVVEDASDRSWILDLKSNRDITTFQFDVRDREYDVQAASYRRSFEQISGKSNSAFIFAGVELEPPHSLRFEQIDHESERLALDIYDADMARIAECVATDNWPRKYPGIGTLVVPKRWLP